MGLLAKQITAVFVLMSATAVLAKDDMSASTIVATVNGTDITLGHMILIRESLPVQYQSTPDEQLFQSILEQMIKQTLLSQINNQTETLRTKLTLENNRRILSAAEAVDAISSSLIDEASIEEAYKLNYLNVGPVKEYNASHILLKTKEKAVKIVKMVKEGMKFADLAIKFSTGPSRQNSGKLGWFRHGMMVPPFEKAVASLKKGEISEPVKTDFGWHVIKLHDVRDLAAPSLKEVRSEIFSQLQQQFVDAKIKKFQQESLIVLRDIEQLDVSVLKKTHLIDG